MKNGDDDRPVGASGVDRETRFLDRRSAISVVWYGAAAIVLLVALFLVSRQSFVLFHSIAEMFSIVIGVSTGLVAWNARRYLDNDYLLFVGIAQMFVAIVDALHMFAYKGMTVFVDGGPNLSTQLWVAGRFLASLSLISAIFFIRRRVPLALVVPLFAAATAVLIALIFERDFPTSYAGGLTHFKIVSEYLIAVLYATAAWLLLRERRWFDQTVMNLIMASIVIRVVAEICFATFVDVYDSLSFTGHYLRIIAFYILYKAIVETGIKRPYAIVLRDLRQREAELQNSVHELEAFSYSVSHDLRSPVAVVDGFAQMLEWQEAERLSPEGRDYVAQIRQSTRRMTELIEDLLSFSRASRADIQIEEVDMSALAREIAERLRRLAPGRSVELQIEENMVGKADAKLLRVVLENLLGNAWKFTSRHPQATIEIRKVEQENEGRGVYMVRDDGAGFDPKTATGRLFHPFQRLHSNADFDGSGIGLATVARIIERHGGRVWADAEVEKGATVYFTLPS